MNERNEYEFDVMMSWTGKDRELKNSIREALEVAGLKVYDSERDCVGRFRDDYTRAIGASKVFLAIMSDNLRNDPNVGGEGTFSEVRKEYDLALDADAHGVLNIQIFNISPVFRSLSVWNIPFDDVIGRYFAAFASANGLSRVDAVPVDGAVPQDKLAELVEKVKRLVRRRDAGTPVPSQYVHSEVAKTEIYGCDTFVGREGEIEQIADAYRRGVRAVVLCGMGGIGKSELARRFAMRYNGKNVAAVQLVSLPDTFLPPKNIDSQLFSVLSAVEYVPSVTARMEGKSERERLDIMCGALRNLPPHALIILDNVNFPYRGLLRRLLSFTKCLFLLTSRVVEKEEPLPATFAGEKQSGSEKRRALLRANQKRLDDAQFAVLPEVTKLPPAEAQELFVRESGRAISGPEFYGLYRLVDGHTICLYLLARVLRANPQKKIAEIAEEFAENRMEERVRLLHNGNEQDATLLAHVDALFDLSQLDEPSLRILRGMALLDNGRIAADELRAAFGLDNNNEINALCEGGWLREGSGVLHLHPVLSRLAAWKLRPSAAKDSAMIEWLLQRAQNAEQLPIGTAIRRENALYYALLVLARSERRLCRPLWERFTELSHRHAAQAEVRERAEELLPLLDDEGERELVRSYADMVLLEQDPSRIDVLAQYLSNLESRAGDYKWVSRMFDVVLQYAVRCPEQHEEARRCVQAALSAAMAEKDDNAALTLSGFLLWFEGERGWKKTILPYVRARKREGEKGGSLLLLELMTEMFHWFPKDMFSSYERMSQAVSAFLRLFFGEGTEEDAALCPKYASLTEHPLRYILLHPLSVVRNCLLSKRFERASEDENDPLQEYFFRLNELIEATLYGGYFNVAVLYEAMLALFECLCSQKLLYGDPHRRALAGTAMLLRSLPVEKRLALFEYARPRALSADEQTSLDDLASMQTFFFVCDSFDGDNEQVLQAEYEAKQTHLRALRSLYAEDDYRILNARWELLRLSEKLEGSVNIREYIAIYRQTLRCGGRADLLTYVGSALLSRCPGNKDFPFMLSEMEEKDFISIGTALTIAACGGALRAGDRALVKTWFEREEREVRSIASKMWDAADGLKQRCFALLLYATRVLAVRDACRVRPAMPASALDWMEKKASALAQELSPQSSPKDAETAFDVCYTCWGFLCKQPASGDRTARFGRFLDVFRLLETRAPRSKRTEMRVGRLHIEGETAAAGGDYKCAGSLLCNGLKLACRKGVFRVGSLRNFREALLSEVLVYYFVRLSADKALPPLGWADGLLGRRVRRCAQRMLDGAVGTCIEKFRSQDAEWLEKNEAEVRKNLGRYSVAVFKDVAKKAHIGNGTPFGILPKKYWRCRSARRYTLAFLEYACQEFGKVKFAIRKQDGGKQT